MKEIKAFNEKRAEIYWWLSSIYTSELSDKELLRYDTHEIRSFLTGLGENKHLSTPIQRLIATLDKLLKESDSQKQLADSFHKLFLTCEQNSPLPYASRYLDHTMHPTAANLIKQLMENNGVHVQTNTDEPYDHIATELDFLAHLIIRSNELEKITHMDEALHFQADYIRNHLLSWLPEFSFHCSSQDKLGFYSAISVLLVAFLQLDLDYLTSK